MAARVLALRSGLGGPAVAAGLGALILGTLAAVAWQAQGLSGLGPWDWRAVRFTVWQAALSAALSAVLAIPVARALARRRFAVKNTIQKPLSANL